VLQLVRTVRNNLFHRGKGIYDPVGDSRLLEAATEILDCCVNLDAEGKNAFLDF